QNNLQQELLKHRADIELLKREFIEKEQQMIEQNNEVTKSLQEKDEQIDRFSKQNNTYQDELKQFQLIINNNDVIDTEIDELKKQIQNKNDEINTLRQEIQLKDEHIQQMERNIEIIKKDFNDKEKQWLSHSNEFNLISIQDSQKYFQKMDDQNKEQTDNQDIIPLSPLCILSHEVKFDSFRSSSKLINTFNGHINRVTSIDYSTFGDCQYLCSGSYDKTVRVWDVDNNKQTNVFEGHSNYVNCVKFSQYHYHNNRCHVVCSSSDDKTICFWDIKDKKQFQVFNGHKDTVWSIGFSSFNNGRYMCSGSRDKTICFWDIATSRLLHIFNGHISDILCVDISPLQSSNNNKNENKKSNNIDMIGGNGYTICSGSYDNTIRIWDIETKKLSINFEGHNAAVNSIKYGLNELRNIILSGSSDKSVRLWDIRSGKQIQIFNGHLNYVTAVEYSPFVVSHINRFQNQCKDESNVICSGSYDKTIRFWDIRSKKGLHVINVDDGAILCLKFISSKKKENEKDSDCEKVIFIFGDNLKFPIWNEIIFVFCFKKMDNHNY
ncbi:hypothetical protein RFI_29335, partial [Reticulomyxa filosa]